MIVQRKYFARFYIFLSLVLAPAMLHAQDAEGCKDSPLITRMPGSTISSCEHQEFGQATMPVGKPAIPPIRRWRETISTGSTPCARA